MSSTYQVGQVLTGRVTRVTDFGAFVELESGIEGLAHMSTFAPTGRSGGWSKSVSPGLTGAFEILSIDPEKKRIGVALVDEGSAKAGAAGTAGGAKPSRPGIVPGARVTGKVERHETFGVFVFLAPGRTGLMPLSETGVDRGGDVLKAFPVGSDVEVIVLEIDPAGRRIRVSHKAVGAAEEAAEMREYTERADVAQAQSFGSLADKLRGALTSRNKQ
jgi:small subunit ribosomal protein S1